MPTKIEWAEETWNPVTGCSPISAGCKHCYAARFAMRFAGRFGYGQFDPFHVTVHPDRLAQPFTWSRRRRVFVCSMGDLFHRDLDDSFVELMFGIMSLAGEHTFMILTKRPTRMRAWFAEHSLSDCQAEFFDRHICEPAREAAERRDKRIDRIREPGARRLARGWHDRAVEGWGNCAYRRWPLPNVWLGVTVEDQDAEKRISHLLHTPAAVRFVSCEPLIGLVDIDPVRMTTLDWLIVGGETGPGARPMAPDWARALRDDCAAAGVPFFFKRMGGGKATPPDLDIRQFPAPTRGLRHKE